MGDKKEISDVDDPKLWKFNIEILNNTYIFNYILRYAGHLSNDNSFLMDEILKYDNEEEYKYNDGKYFLNIKIPYGTSYINFQNNQLKFIYIEEKQNAVGTAYNVRFLELIKIYSNESVKHISDFILKSRNFCEPTGNEKVVCRTLKNSSWTVLSKLPKRSMDTIFLDSVKNNIIDDIQDFLDSEDDYIRFGQPYKRNYLLHGPPGTGKTSLIFSIASKFDLDISIISFDPKLDDSSLLKAISNLHEDCILLLEDIDTLFIERKKNIDSCSNVSLSCILNILDGVGRKHKMITFITTNYIDKLDDALKRKGRIDIDIEFDVASEIQIKEMFSYYFKTIKLETKELRTIKNMRLTTGVLQSFFFKNRKLNNKEELLKILYKECKKETSNSTLYV